MHTTRRSFLTTLITAAIPLSTSHLLTAAYEDEFTVLFQGDSITDGNRGRNDDPNHILGHGYAFSIASDLGARFPDRHLKFINKGNSGDKIADLLTRWKEDSLDLKPDVLSILVGINDILMYIKTEDNFNAQLFEKQYSELLERTKKSLPDSILAVGEPFILPVGMVNKNSDKWKQMVTESQSIVRKIAREYDAIFLPYQKMFSDACTKASPEYWIWDGIHPTYAGHGLMKKMWITEVSKRCVKIRE
jgi:lysophospholipase L1-like esterase